MAQTFQHLLIAKRQKVYLNDPLKGVYKIIQATQPIYEPLASLSFVLKEPSLRQKKLNRPVKCAMSSGSGNRATFSSALFIHNDKNGIYYARNIAPQDEKTDLLIIQHIPDDDELNILVAPDIIINSEDWDKYLAKLDTDYFDNEIDIIKNELVILSN